MCRLAAYSGEKICLQSLLLEPKYSLFTQSWQPKELNYAKLNADGFGFGWYDQEGIPASYRNCAPIWADVNLEGLARVLQSSLWLAMVRSATSIDGFSPINVQPFQYKNYLFMHNGFIRDFRQDGLQKILATLKPEIIHNIHGSTDSEYIFNLFCHFIADTPAAGPDVIKTALLKTLTWITHNLPTTKTMLNIIVSDGEALVATRFATHETPPSLYIHYGDGIDFPHNARIIASERFSDTDDWQIVPPYSSVVAGDQKKFIIEAI